jgi:hypothetical protein
VSPGVINLRRTKKLLAITETFGITMKKGGFLFTKPLMELFLKKAGKGRAEGDSPFTANELSFMSD